MDLTTDLIDFARATPPPDAQAMMRLSALDWAACGCAGAADGGFDAFAAPYRGQGPGTVIGGGAAALADAALVNGTLSHALDYDDTHFDHIGHPSVAIMPAAFAIGQAQGATLHDIVDAALIGAEASVAVGLWLGRGHYQIGYHQTATAGAFGATLAAARLVALPGEEVRHALGLAATMASGIKAPFGTMGKPLNAGLAARTGVEAALWAARGMTGPADGLAGPLGFGATHHGAGQAVDLPAADWRMLRISHKYHACCHGLHAMLEAIRPFAGQTVDRVTIHTHPRWLSVCNIAAPTTGLEAKFSYRFTAAMALCRHDTAAIGSFTDALTRDPALASVRDRVAVEADDSLTEMQARVIVDGVESVHDLDAPIPMETRQARLLAKARSLVGGDADALWSALVQNDRAAFEAVLTKARGRGA